MPFRSNRNSRDDKSAKSNRSYSSNRSGDRPFKKDKPFKKREDSNTKDASFSSDRNTKSRNWDSKRSENRTDRPHKADRKWEKGTSEEKTSFSPDRGNRKVYNRERNTKNSTKHFVQERRDDGLIRLNRYISNSGVCSRRKADELIQAGVVTVNGTVITELGTKVDPIKDEIRYNGEKLKREKMVYVLLNKPKDYITTTDDPQERRTVMHLVEKATKERIYPVGRLDRNTTGLLLLTNDGNLAEKLSHPRNRIMKIYHVELSKNLTQGDFNKIEFGVELEDGFIKPDDISYIQGASKREVGIQIHSGKNRIVRRIFESLGYEIVKLDRVIYANLTKKDLPRGRWRYLEEKELIQLKHFIK